MDRCWAFTLAYNERVLIPYWVREYRTWCERVIVYVDQTSTDRTEIAAGLAGAEVRPYDRGGTLDDMVFVAWAQEHYPEARGQAEWVLWVDADEILWHPQGMGERLDALRAQGVTYPRTQGYQMMASAPPSGPKLLTEQIRMGVPAPEYDKPAIFSPELEVIWTPGKHTAEVRGAAASDDGTDPIRLLHYRYLGEAWLRARNERNYARIPDGQRVSGLGREVYPYWNGRYSAEWFAGQLQHAREVVT